MVEQPQLKKGINQKTIDIVQSTAPILKKQGKQITTRMYEIMFQNYPEVKAQFDMSAQANGSQPVKLANAVLSYATHIDNLDALKSMVETIAHRHVQTHVQPKQYPIVGECLLLDGVTSSLKAWLLASWRIWDSEKFDAAEYIY